MSEHRLNIFDGSHRLGQIIYNAKDEHFSFTYEDQWITSPTAYPLSPHFPLTEKHASSSTIRRFVENLLPEGRALDIASAHYNVTKNNVFALIRQLGQETAGALSFVADGQERLADTTSRREVSSEEMAARIARRDELPFALWDGKVRMSVAGFQDKLALYFEGSGVCQRSCRVTSSAAL